MAIQMMTDRAEHNVNLAALQYTDAVDGPAPRTISSDWRQRLPVLTGNAFHLRELRTSDAASLFAMLTTEEVARFISPPPTTVEGFVKFIDWTHRRRAEGRHVCFAVVPDGHDAAVGIIQFHALEDGFGVAEWGFALGSAYWGTGLFAGAAQAGPRFRVRQRGGAAHGGQGRQHQRARQRRPSENGSGAGGHAPAVVLKGPPPVRPEPVVDPARATGAGPRRPGAKGGSAFIEGASLRRR